MTQWDQLFCASNVNFPINLETNKSFSFFFFPIKLSQSCSNPLLLLEQELIRNWLTERLEITLYPLSLDSCL